VTRATVLLCAAALTGLLAAAPAAPVPPPKPRLSPRVGDKAPALLGIYSDGDASAVRPWKWAGRHTLVVFWSPGDAASVRQLAELRRLHRDFSGERFQIVSVAVARKRDGSDADEWNDWIRFMGQQRAVVGPDGGRKDFYLAWPHLFEAESHDPRNFPPDRGTA
jgi:hypothetical protein